MARFAEAEVPPDDRGEVDSSEFDLTPFSRRTDKPWGYEIIWTPDDLPYVGKLLVVRAGHMLSLQYHKDKLETQTLLQGQVIMWLEGPQGSRRFLMEPSQGYTIHPYQIHRLEALQFSVIAEVSVPERGDTKRLEDLYGRQAVETEEMRELPDRGWERSNTPTSLWPHFDLSFLNTPE